MNTPFAFHKKKKCEKVCTKKIVLIFLSTAGFEPQTLQNIGILKRGALATAAMPSVSKFRCIIQSYSKYFWRPIIKEAGTRTHNHLGKNFWLVFVVLYMAYQFQVGEQSGNGFWWGFEVVFKIIYYYIRNFRVWKIFFLMLKFIFFWILFS